MAKSDRKQEARRLRARGLMFAEIAKRLNISKSTAGLWCKDLKLTSIALAKLAKKAGDGRQRGRLLGSQAIKRARLERVNQAETEARKLIGMINARDLLVAGAALYWGEGSKDRKLTFTNTNPHMLRFVLKWFFDSLNVAHEDIRVWIYINSTHADRSTQIFRFWRRELGLPAAQFANPVLLKARQGKVYEKRETYYGVVSLRIKKSTELQYKILGLIKAMQLPA
ncbi:MAG: hypothetical protein WDN10_04560 [bacterium]